ncbi:sulfotransferase [Xanthomarina sp. GH4-25]|uniref:sulfotransferase n=1 Tax=Xanthomarina sp. GH4-25 TaxID=3349335 RepID=UPI003877E081
MLFKKPKEKIFCIGHNKTGTTTIEAVLHGFGYKLGNQIEGELLLDAWHARDFNKIIKFCNTAQAFQDIPFSLPYTYQHLDVAFKNAKFILTERDNAEQWYVSLTKFHSKLWADGETIPTAMHLKQASYRYKGYSFNANRYIYPTPENDIYNKDLMMRFYLNYNQTVKDYFKSRPEKLLVINVSKSTDYAKLCQFLGQPITRTDFPWKNKT